MILANILSKFKNPLSGTNDISSNKSHMVQTNFIILDKPMSSTLTRQTKIGSRICLSLLLRSVELVTFPAATSSNPTIIIIDILNKNNN